MHALRTASEVLRLFRRGYNPTFVPPRIGQVFPWTLIARPVIARPSRPSRSSPNFGHSQVDCGTYRNARVKIAQCLGYDLHLPIWIHNKNVGL